MAIEVINRQRLSGIDKPSIAALAEAALTAVGRSGAGLTVVFIRDRAMSDLNRQFRGKDGTTDVLSFRAADGEKVERVADGEKFGFLGDIAISVDRAQQQARDIGHSLARELEELVLHGVLHLCGYDHETDRGEMNRLELRLRRKLLTDE